VIRQLREAQHSKHAMLLHAVAEAAGSTSPATPEIAAFKAGCEVLAEIQATDGAAAAWLFGLPHLGGWAHDCLIHLEQGSEPDFAYLACAVAAAAIRAGVPFELDVPVRDGGTLLPGLGVLLATGQVTWVRLRSDGERLTVGCHRAMATHDLRPDDGSGRHVPHWRGTPMIHVLADGLAWDVLLETNDPYLDRYALPMAAVLSPDELGRWRERVQAAWEVLVRHHRETAEPIADGIAVIVPLTPKAETDLVSGTSPAAFGAVATSWPPDPVTMAETLVHEFQHVKLCGLMDMVPLTEPGGEKVYAPWRQDPRPASGLLQGIYAHLGIVRFWWAQQHAETDPDDIFRAQVQYARWQPAIDRAVRTLRETGCLTPAGVRAADILHAHQQSLALELVPADARELAREVALDHWLTWQIRHVAFDPAEVANLAAAYRRGEPRPETMQLRTWIQENVRKTDSALRTRLLNMRYLAPARYRALCAGENLQIGEPDRLLLSGATAAAVQAYRGRITASADPQPDAWIGLVLALHQLPFSSAPLQGIFATRLALIYAMHSYLRDAADPLHLASWFA
jgi:HEXXH motif-containing protein